MNNAGAGATGALLDFPVDKARDVFDTNLFAPMRLTQLVVPHMASKKTGLIINIGSVVGVVPTPWAGESLAVERLGEGSADLRLPCRGLLDIEGGTARMDRLFEDGSEGSRRSSDARRARSHHFTVRQEASRLVRYACGWDLSFYMPWMLS